MHNSCLLIRIQNIVGFRDLKHSGNVKNETENQNKTKPKPGFMGKDNI